MRVRVGVKVSLRVRVGRVMGGVRVRVRVSHTTHRVAAWLRD